MRASTALACLVGMGAMSAGCTLLNSGDDLLRDSGVRPDVSMGDAYVPLDAFCAAGPESDDAQCKDLCDNDGNGQTDCSDPSCASVAICRPTCTLPSDCTSGWCVSNVCVPTMLVTVRVRDGQAPLSVTLATHDAAGGLIQTVSTDSVTGSAVVEALAGGDLVVTGPTTLHILYLPVELDGETLSLSMEASPTNTSYSAASGLTASDTVLATGCDSGVTVHGSDVGTVSASGHCTGLSGPVVLGCDRTDGLDCGIARLVTGVTTTVTAGSAAEYGLTYNGISPVLSTITFRIGNSELRTWDAELVAHPTWMLPDVTTVGAIAQITATTSNGGSDTETVTFATKTPATFSITNLPGVITGITRDGTSTSWTAPSFSGSAPSYYSLYDSGDPGVSWIIPGDTTSVAGNYDQIGAVWDSRSDLLGNAYAGALLHVTEATLENNVVVATSFAY